MSARIRILRIMLGGKGKVFICFVFLFLYGVCWGFSYSFSV